MNTRAKTMILAFSLASMLAAPFAEAARMGGGRSSGMRRSTATQSYTPPPAQAAPAAAPAPAQKSGIGVGTAEATGVAGAAAGYMIGSAMNNNGRAAAPSSAPVATAAPAPAPAQPGIPWHLVALLGLIFVVGLIWFRRRVGMPNGLPPSMGAPLQAPRDSRFDPIPAIGSGIPGYSNNTPQQLQDTGLRRLPDGTETPYFMRQAKATFQHLQSLNSPDSVDEVRRYMTPELFAELRGDIGRNGDVADFPQLDCQLLSAGEEEGRYVASVRYSGLVSEEVNAAPVPFSETWHFVKDTGSGLSGKWMVAGIQQNN